MLSNEAFSMWLSGLGPLWWASLVATIFASFCIPFIIKVQKQQMYEKENITRSVACVIAAFIVLALGGPWTYIALPCALITIGIAWLCAVSDGIGQQGY